MAKSLIKQVQELKQFVDDFHAGLFPQRTVLGPGSMDTKFLKSKSITSSMLDVSNLEAVSSSTGNLTVTGGLSAGTGGNSMGWTPDDGLFLGNATAGSAPFRVTPSGDMVAESATIEGDITTSNLSATGGSIAGFSISDSSGLTFGSGTQARGFSPGTVALFVGNSTPGSAPFRVDRFGNFTSTSANVTGTVTATNGSIGGVSISSNQLNVGSAFIVNGSTGAFTATNANITGAIDANSGTLGNLTVDGSIGVGPSGNIRSGATSFTTGTGWILEYNSGTPRMRIGTTSGNRMTWDGSTLTVRGRLEFGTGDYLEDDVLHFETGGTSTTNIEIGRAGFNPHVLMRSTVQSSGSILTLEAFHSTSSVHGGHLNINSTSAGGSTTLGASRNGGPGVYFFATAGSTASVSHAEVILLDSAGSSTFRVRNASGDYIFGVNSSADLIYYPTASTSAIGTYYGKVPIFVNGVRKYIAVYNS